MLYLEGKNRGEEQDEQKKTGKNESAKIPLSGV